MNIRFINARILTMAEGEEIYEGSLYTQDEKIVYTGPALSAEAEAETLPDGYTVDRTIDCSGNLLMPGFKNAHAHSGMSVLRSCADDMPLGDWLNKQIFPREARLDAQMIADATALSVLEYLTSGMTACFDMYLTPESEAAAYRDMGYRAVLCGNLNNFSSSVEYTEEMYDRLNHFDPLITYEIGFHAEYTCSDELMKSLSEMAHKHDAPVYTHLAETESEVAGCVERYGMTPAAYLDSIGMWDNGGGGFHCVHMSDQDIDIFERRGLHVITNPGSNTKLASGIAPIRTYLERGINTGIGTDGPASNNCLDMFREMFLTTGLAKLREKDAAVVDAMDVLHMATVGSARAMRLYDADILTAGKLADIIMIDLHQPNMMPFNNIAKNIVYSGSKSNVKMTMINGRILYMDGAFDDSYDVERIYARAQEIIDTVR
ncbi:MAG: amidohydrolase [Lachnospiraceae bacterium]|nr:amidohydrolase [Lachnospiraceae bacterium]